MPPFGHAAGYTLVATIHHTEIHMRRFAGMGTRSMMLVAVLAAAAPSLVEAQYFGRNKVQYQTFDFRVQSTEHYDLHFYPAESLATADAGRIGEDPIRLGALESRRIRGC